MKDEFIKAIERHQGIIFKVSKMYRDTPQDQEDLYQDIVLQLWKAYPGFKGKSKITTWMYRIGLNTAMATFRKRKINVEYTNKTSNNFSMPNEQQLSDEEDQLFAAIRTLNKADRSILALYLEAYTYREIAEVVGISEAYVAVKMNRIKSKLKETLKG